MQTAANIFAFIVALATAFMLAADAGLVPDDMFAIAVPSLLWAFLTIPGFTEEHEYWVDAGMAIKSACDMLGIRWPRADER